jgi:hypothetical protein
MEIRVVVAYVVFFLAAAFTFIPSFVNLSVMSKVPTYEQFRSGNETLTSVYYSYPAYLSDLKSPFTILSLGFSIGCSSPLLLDFVLDKFISKRSEIISSFTSHLNSIRRIAFFVVIVDISYVAYLIPFDHYNLIFSVLLFRDIIFTFEFLINLNKLFPNIWNFWIVTLTASCFAIGDILLIPISLSMYLSIANLAFTACVAVGLFLFLLLFARWIYFVCHNNDPLLQSKIYLCNAYAGTFSLFLSGVWGLFLTPSSDVNWYSVYGRNYFVMYQYLISFTVIGVTMVATRLAKKEATQAEVWNF